VNVVHSIEIHSLFFIENLMLITFKSSAAADVLMYKAHAKPLLDVLEKEIDQGIITANEMAGAISLLENEITRNKSAPATSSSNLSNEKDTDDDLDTGKIVSLSARAYPLLEMMRASLKEKTFIMWGV
jgi:Domain of unknown function (DUF1840)